MKRLSFALSLAVAMLALGFHPVVAAANDLTAWFMRATAFNTQGKTTRMTRPEILPGTPRSMDCHYIEHRPNFTGVWQLLSYDRVHHIAFATATTDQCSLALFRAPAPDLTVPNEDLSGYATRLGVHIGSTYDSVRKIYGGGAPKSASHFVVRYSSDVPGETVSMPHKKIAMPQVVTVVFDQQRVSSISIYTDVGGEY
ncbi:MAG TPA: hypothetical protein VN936_04850 [Candidatus Acidoferrum sp.]|nr:hypothetical protein [Candidatus Acidoferrum sp.]